MEAAGVQGLIAGTVVRRFLGDLHIVDMRFTHAGRGDFHELGLVAQLVYRRAAAVTHGLAYAADHLEDDGQHAALVGHAAFDAFGHELVGLHARFLEITVGRAVRHRADAAHAAIRFVAAALVQDHFAGRLFRAGEHRAHHDGRRAGGQRLRDVARVADAAVGDARHAGAFERLGDVGDRGDLRHADAGDDAGGADRARTDADLDRVRAVFDQRLGGGRRGDVAADHVDLRELGLDPFHAVEDALRMAVGRVDHQHVDAGGDQQLDAFLILLADADGGADQQLALRILRCQRVLGRLLDVLDRDQAAQFELVVDHQHALEAVLVHQALGLGRVGVLVDVDQIVARRHLGARLGVEFLFKAQVAVGDDADHHVAFDDRETGNTILLGQRDDVADLHLRRNRDRVAQHAGLEALDAQHFARLVLRAQILVDDADAALLRHGDRQTGFGHRVHRGRQQRDVQRDIAGQASFQGRIGRQNIRIRWNEEHVIKGQCFLEETHSISYRRKSRLYRFFMASSLQVGKTSAKPPPTLTGQSNHGEICRTLY